MNFEEPEKLRDSGDENGAPAVWISRSFPGSFWLWFLALAVNFAFWVGLYKFVIERPLPDELEQLLGLCLWLLMFGSVAFGFLWWAGKKLKMASGFDSPPLPVRS